MTTTVTVRTTQHGQTTERRCTVPLAAPPHKRIDAIRAMPKAAQERIQRLAYTQFARRVGLPLIS